MADDENFKQRIFLAGVWWSLNQHWRDNFIYFKREKNHKICIKKHSKMKTKTDCYDSYSSEKKTLI